MSDAKTEFDQWVQQNGGMIEDSADPQQTKQQYQQLLGQADQSAKGVYDQEQQQVDQAVAQQQARQQAQQQAAEQARLADEKADLDTARQQADAAAAQAQYQADLAAAQQRAEQAASQAQQEQAAAQQQAPQQAQSDDDGGGSAALSFLGGLAQGLAGGMFRMPARVPSEGIGAACNWYRQHLTPEQAAMSDLSRNCP